MLTTLESVNVSRHRPSNKSCDVAVIGAGPYGLSATAHLRTIKGADVRTFGRPMSFWRQNMPVGMLLRSNWTATQIADPNGFLTLEAYQKASGKQVSAPVPLDRFVDYGLWYQSQAVTDLDTREVVRLEAKEDGFHLTLEDDGVVQAGRVVLAAGIGPFAWIPAGFQYLPSSLCSHTSSHSNFQAFTGKEVLVVGGGQSALESGALMHEAGAKVQIVARTRHIHWLQGAVSKTLHHRLGRATSRFLYAPTDVGPAGISQVMARPYLVRRLPRSVQNRLRNRCIRPAGARWLLPRLQNVPIHFGRSVVSSARAGDRIRVRLDNQTESLVDHVLLGTGYRIDIAKYAFLAPKLLDSIQRMNGFPILNEGFETSVPGLHILGAPAAWSFGPLMQFVSGTTYTSHALLRYLSGNTR
jgi:FAD-dependent urate hydroxylase